MKKLLVLMVTLTLTFTLAACSETVRLPNMVGSTRSEIEQELDDLGLDFYIVHDESVERDQPEMFLRYLNHNIGAEVEVGDRVQVVVSSKLEEEEHVPRDPVPTHAIEPDEDYTDIEDITLYLDTFGELPQNFITYDEANEMGFTQGELNLDDVTDGELVGDIPFDSSDYEDIPTNDERSYYKAFVEYDSGDHHGAYVVYSNDGLVFYTPDNFENIEQHFGTPEHPPRGLVETKFYTDTDDVALYIRTFRKLPPNYIIRYDEDRTDRSAPAAWNLYRQYVGEPDEDFYEDHDFGMDLANTRHHYLEVENEHGQSLGEHLYYGYWWFHGASSMPGRTDFFIADTRLPFGSGSSRGRFRFVFSPEKRLVYFTEDHFDSYTLLYGNADD